MEIQRGKVGGVMNINIPEPQTPEGFLAVIIVLEILWCVGWLC